jgi:hypothetical protein
MKKLFLKFKNQIAKLALSVLGFTLAASQCLAQYMAYIPKTTIYGRIIGITDTISRFRIVANEYDTTYSTWNNGYSFEYQYELEYNSKMTFEVSDNTQNRSEEYFPVTNTLAIKPDEDREHEVIIELIKKD